MGYTNQIYVAWKEQRKMHWLHDKKQPPSARKLPPEYGDNVDIFNVDIPDEVEMLAWGMKRIVEPLKRKNVEIGGRIQHTCVMRSVLILGIDSTMSKHLELYSTISEYENARFPMTYCLLSTATVIDVWEAKINPCGGTSDVR